MVDLGSNTIVEIAIVGSGKLATNLVTALLSKNMKISYLSGRNAQTIQILAQKTNAKVIKLEQLQHTTDKTLVFLCIPDSALHSVIESLVHNNRLILIQLSGSIPLFETNENQAKTAVFYPLMTFSPDRYIRWDKIPVFLEATSDVVKEYIENLANILGNNYRYMNASQRKVLHLAAVFANNFVNHNLAIAFKLCEEENIQFDFLKPLVEETIAKAFETNPVNVQTGPAMRNDIPVINEHLKMLSELVLFQKIYESNTQSIQNINH